MSDVLTILGDKLRTADNTLDDCKGRFSKVLVIGYSDSNDMVWDHNHTNMNKSSMVFLLQRLSNCLTLGLDPNNLEENEPTQTT